VAADPGGLGRDRLTGWAVGNPLAVPAVDALFLPCLLVTLLGLVAGAWSLLGRFRRAQGTERLQLRWLALAAAVSAATLLLALATVFLSRSSTLFEVAFGVSIGVLPLAGGYAVVVLGLGQLLGRDSSLVVAAATLTVAAVFQPARRRIQQGVDRHVNRRRHDAARSIEMSMLQVSAHETVRARWAGSPRGRSAPPGRGRTPPRWLRVGAS
jgi:hypothetical protein